MPIKSRQELIEIDSQDFPGLVAADSPAATNPAGFDLVVLAMQEPQYSQPDVRALLGRVARSRIPVMSIMNMPPLAYLARIPRLNIDALRGCYDDATLWDAFDPALMTLCSPDPQAFRPPGEPLNTLQVRLPTNFKCAAFERPSHTAILRQLEADIEGSRTDIDGVAKPLPVNLKVHNSVFVPLAKWPMLIAGNYRCVGPAEMRSIAEAVHADPAASRSIYDWVADLVIALGADAADLVSFDKYAQAAQSLANPSSAARALTSGTTAIERVDKLVQTVAATCGRSNKFIDQIVACVDGWLARNRAMAAA